MDDLICRDDAINAHCMCSCGKERDEYCKCDDIPLWFDVLPSVQPKRKPYHEEWISALRTAQPDFDTVAKIDKAHDDGYKQGYLQCKADYERKKGKWLLNGGRRCECSICHHEGNIYGNANFCEHCGADMRGNVE